jgi:hypothetical protein
VALSLLAGVRTEEARALCWDHVVTWVDDAPGGSWSARSGSISPDQERPASQFMSGAPIGSPFTEVVLRPRVKVNSPDMIEKAVGLHRDAHEKCFIARSVNFQVRHEPVMEAAAARSARAVSGPRFALVAVGGLLGSVMVVTVLGRNSVCCWWV